MTGLPRWRPLRPEAHWLAGLAERPPEGAKEGWVPNILISNPLWRGLPSNVLRHWHQDLFEAFLNKPPMQRSSSRRLRSSVEAEEAQALLATLCQRRMGVRAFVQKFWSRAEGYSLSDAVLKDTINNCLNDPLPQWEMELDEEEEEEEGGRMHSEQPEPAAVPGLSALPEMATEAVTELPALPETATEAVTELPALPDTATEAATELLTLSDTATEAVTELPTLPDTATEAVTELPALPDTAFTELPALPDTATEHPWYPYTGSAFSLLSDSTFTHTAAEHRRASCHSLRAAAGLETLVRSG
ncbi:hypothetical protein DPX16_6135 [Anabarilius grahami]|uniref:Uncharacterized protein n=1 Tax=Anabarilius grahami TaxID=495550 RepID=A0A3N0Z2D6_ANAGA|nr:hypothetical protein DPX16_6135 [Anabarilius grahami]